MKVKNLKLTDFRNYQTVDVNFESGINLIYGNNASGKTNLVEAIVLCSLGKSFRTNEDINLIRSNQEFSKVEVEYESSRVNQIKFVISEKGKRVELNEVLVNKLSNLSGNLLTLTFVPEDVLMFKDSPSVRRKFLDISISGMKKEYIENLLEYRNFIKQRNALLKENEVDTILLETLEERMLDSQYLISNYRRDILKEMEERLNITFNKINQKENKIKIKYLSDFAISKPYEEFKEIAKEKYLDTRENDLRKKNTTIGIHKDDFKIYLNEMEVGEYASQGQNRLMVLSLKLSLARVIKEITKEDPIVILDDVLSELDNHHQERMIEELKEYEQVFITSAKDENLSNVTKYNVQENLVIRRN